MGLGLIIVGALVDTDGSNTDHVRLVLNSITVTEGSSKVGSLVNILSIPMIVTGVAILVVTWFSILGIVFRKKYLLITVRTKFALKTKWRHLVINDVENQHMAIFKNPSNLFQKYSVPLIVVFFLHTKSIGLWGSSLSYDSLSINFFVNINRSSKSSPDIFRLVYEKNDKQSVDL